MPGDTRDKRSRGAVCCRRARNAPSLSAALATIADDLRLGTPRRNLGAAAARLRTGTWLLAKVSRGPLAVAIAGRWAPIRSFWPDDDTAA